MTRNKYPCAVVQRDVMVAMRDGVRLATDIYLPSEDGNAPASEKFPVLLSRTPYSKERAGVGRRAGAQEQGTRGARNGFAVVIQDTRGRYRSEGNFRSMQDDGQDGWDTLDWIGRQEWCSGRVGTYGVSYLGAVQMMLAPMQPPLLFSAFSEQPSSDEFTDRTFHSGALTLANVEGWAVNSSGEQYNQRVPSELRARAEAELQQYRELGPQGFEVLPLRDVPWLRLIPGIWGDVLDHVEDPSFFAPNDIRSKLDRVRVPIYHLGGWFDPFLRNTIDHYKGALRVQPDQRLIIGPWMHGGMGSDEAGETRFRDAAFDDFGYAMAWHDRWLRDGVGHPAVRHPVILYVMGANRWRAEEAWPLPGTQMTSFLLDGGGTLSTDVAQHETPDTYRYDPHNPVRTPAIGRNVVNSLLERQDVLVYRSSPLEGEVEVTGEITATLYASSSAEDTDWMMWLVDIDAEGRAWQVVDGVVRARYREDRLRPRQLMPNKVERYEINMWATSLVFGRGHRIGVVIGSSNFPKYDRHPNRYVDLWGVTERDFLTVTQQVHHAREWPSAVHLPIVDMAEHQGWIENPMPVRDRV